MIFKSHKLIQHLHPSNVKRAKAIIGNEWIALKRQIRRFNCRLCVSMNPVSHTDYRLTINRRKKTTTNETNGNTYYVDQARRYGKMSFAWNRTGTFAMFSFISLRLISTRHWNAYAIIVMYAKPSCTHYLLVYTFSSASSSATYIHLLRLFMFSVHVQMWIVTTLVRPSQMCMWLCVWHNG